MKGRAAARNSLDGKGLTDETGPSRRIQVSLTLAQGAILVSIARDAIDRAVEGRSIILPSPLERGEGTGFLKSRRGAFVTLSKLDGELRGCIGIPFPVRPLGEAVVEAAVGAATRDPRFPRVVATETGSLTVEVSALTEPLTIECKAPELPKHVRVGTDGLVVSGMGTSGLLLPQVGSEMGLTPEAFLSLTCQKAGLLPDAWLDSRVRVMRFQAEVFSEGSPRGAVELLKGLG